MLAKNNPLLKFFTISVTLLGLHGCAAQKTYTYSPQSMEINLSGPTINGSSSEYLRAANEQPSPERENYLLTAAVKLIDEHALDRAEQIVDSVSDANLTPTLSSHKKLLKAHLDLMKGKNHSAMRALSQIQPDTLPEHYRIQFHRLLAHAYENQGNTLQAIEQRIKLSTLLTNPKNQHANKEKLWNTLLQIKSVELRMMKLEQPQKSTLTGWIELALIAHDSNTPEDLAKQLQQWHAEYPDHPGSDLLEGSGQSIDQIKQIALLLPSTGPLAKPAQAIREGFMAARFSNKQNINVKLYNTDKADVASLYQQAVNDGNQIVIGPLSKANVNRLLDVYDSKVPVLTLNYSDTANKRESLYEFGLSPIDEVQQVAARGWQNGYRNALVIAPQGNWGEFIAKNFEEIWQSFGGSILNKWYFSEKDKYNDKIKELLNLNYSYNRIWFAKSVTGNYKIKAVPRRRQDIDMIFVLAYPSQIRQILPLLRFYYANDVNIMSISMGYVPGAPARINRDLDGIYFCDMPWMFTHDDPHYYQLSKQWPEQYNQYVRLYALGFDAFKLSEAIPKLPLLPSYAMNGSTGYLRIDDTNHVRRQLQWARVNNGKAEKL